MVTKVTYLLIGVIGRMMMKGKMSWDRCGPGTPSLQSTSSKIYFDQGILVANAAIQGVYVPVTTANRESILFTQEILDKVHFKEVILELQTR